MALFYKHVNRKLSCKSDVGPIKKPDGTFCSRFTVVSPESGDSSVVIRWTVDLEIVNSKPTDGRNYNFCSVLALQVYPTLSVKYVPAFGGRDPPHRAGT